MSSLSQAYLDLCRESQLEFQAAEAKEFSNRIHRVPEYKQVTIIFSFSLTSNQNLAFPSIINVGKKSQYDQQNLWPSSIEITDIFIPHHSCCSCLQITFVLITTLRLQWLLDLHQILLFNVLIKTYMVLQHNFFP